VQAVSRWRGQRGAGEAEGSIPAAYSERVRAEGLAGGLRC